jgi:hypothetical protein
VVSGESETRLATRLALARSSAPGPGHGYRSRWQPPMSEVARLRPQKARATLAPLSKRGHGSEKAQ